MTEFEVRQLITDANGAINDQFQFWMAATFAVVVAAYTAGPQISRRARGWLATIYLLAVATFLVRWAGAGREMGEDVQRLREIGATLGVVGGAMPVVVASLRLIVIILGTTVAAVMILRPSTLQPRRGEDP